MQSQGRQQEQNAAQRQHSQVEPGIDQAASQNGVVHHILGVGQRGEIGNCTCRWCHFAEGDEYAADEEQSPAQERAGHLHIARVGGGHRAECQTQGRERERPQQNARDEQPWLKDGRSEEQQSCQQSHT